MSEKCISSGILSASERIVEEECWIVGAVLTSGNIDAKAIFYDSGNEDLADKLEVGFVSNAVPAFNKIVHCLDGIYAELLDGAEVMVFYTK